VSPDVIGNLGIWTLSGRHLGGANVLSADGPVHYYKYSTNLSIVWALRSRAEGEVAEFPSSQRSRTAGRGMTKPLTATSSWGQSWGAVTTS
jgi:hypothetical protein